jgi:hypothetical protein
MIFFWSSNDHSLKQGQPEEKAKDKIQVSGENENKKKTEETIEN